MWLPDWYLLWKAKRALAKMPPQTAYEWRWQIAKAHGHPLPEKSRDRGLRQPGEVSRDSKA